MALDLDGEKPSVFPHNREFKEGVKERGIRPGQATVVVALDGSGDAETIQEGIDMLPKTGGEVKVKEGEYKITDTIIIDSNTQLSGTGRQTIIVRHTATYDAFIQNKTRSGAGNKNILINNLAFRNDRTYLDSGSHVIDFLCVSGCTIGNNLFESNERLKSAVYLQASEYTTIINNLIKHSHAGAAIRLVGSSKNIIIANVFQPVTESIDGGVSLDSTSERNIVSSNSMICEGSGAAGVYGVTVAGDENIVTNNQIENVTETAGLIVENTADRTLVVGNISYNNSGGNYSDAGSNTTASGNIFA